jgi:hypothetical protein
MKKQKKDSALSWLKDAGLKSAVFFLILAGAFYAYGAISWPADKPSPVTGVVGMFVGESSAAFTAATNSYDKVNALCANNPSADIADSHICSSMEMMNSYNHGISNSPINTYNSSPSLWINNGPPGYTASANDCKGWTATTRGSDADPNFGAMWIFANKAGGLTPCSTGRKFACCK